MKKYIIVLLLLLVSSLYSQTILTNFEEIKSYAANHSLEYQESQIVLLEKGNSITSVLKLEDSTFSATVIYDEEGNQTYSTSADINILEQLSVSANISENLDGTIGININPFKHNGNSDFSTIQYKLEYLKATETLKDVENSAVENSLNWIIASKKLDSLEKKTNLYFNIYNDSIIRFEAGDITLDELQETLLKYSDARKELLEMEQTYRSIENKLYQSLGATIEDVTVSLFTIDFLKQELDKIKEAYIDGNFKANSSYEYNLSLLNTQLAKSKLDNTWYYTPDVNLKGNIPFNNQEILKNSISGSVTFSLSLNDFTAEEREIAQKEYNLALKSSALTLKEAESEYKKSIEKVNSSTINSQISELGYKQSELLYSEAKILYQSGEYSALDLEEVELIFLQSKNSLYEAYSQEYISRLKHLTK